MPAMRAVARTSALGMSSARTSAMTSAVVTNSPVATAVREVSFLCATSTMRARP